MIAWYAWLMCGAGAVQAVICLFAGARRHTPNDITLGGTVLLALLLLVQIVIAIVAPFAGNYPSGDPLEFWLYLIVALALPVGAAVWALVDRSRWANFVLAIVGLSIAVMSYRMLVIWGG